MNVKINETTQSNEINWDEPCLITDSDEVEVWINMPLIKMDDPAYFAATCISNPTGMHTTGLKKHFKPFNGTITLSND